ncbi:MAG: aconitase X swivel domain-containing protein [Methanobacteriota archaeon]
MNVRGRRIAPGRAEATALVARAPFSFVGGCDAATGEILDEATGVRGERLAGRAFAFPRGKGSTVGSYVVYGLAKRRVGPAAILAENADAIVAVGAILGEVPTVDRLDLGAFLTGDRVLVDADAATVGLPDVEERPVVTAILRNRGRILLVRRSERVGSLRGKWSGISGYLEGSEDPRDRAVKEIREETGIRGARFRGAGQPLASRDGSTAYVVHPFLFDAPGRTVRLDWENEEYRWVRPEEIEGFATVPRLPDVIRGAIEASRIRTD